MGWCLAMAAPGRQSRAGRAPSRARRSSPACASLVDSVDSTDTSLKEPKTLRRLLPPRQARAGCGMRSAALSYCLGQATARHQTAAPLRGRVMCLPLRLRMRENLERRHKP